MTKSRQYLIPAAMLLLTGCMSMGRGTKQFVRVTSEPTGAAVTVDGKPKGMTPVTVEVTRGQRHEVSLVRDSLRADIVLSRHASPALLWYLLLGAPGLVFAGVDLMSGAAINVSDETVALRPALPASTIAAEAASAITATRSPKPDLPVIDRPLKPNDRLRLAKADAGEPATFVLVDSVYGDRVVGRTLLTPDALRADTTTIAIAAGDARRVAVYQPPDRAAGGLAMTRQSIRALAPFLAVPQGGMVALLAYPAGYATGATLAEPRWTPREAHRVGSPLLVNDTVEVRFTEDHRPNVRGRLLDLDRNDLVLASVGTQIRVARKDVLGLQRVDGYHYKAAAIVMTILGAFAGGYTCRISDACRNAGISHQAMTAAAAVTGLLLSPALAARKWSEVERW